MRAIGARIAQAREEVGLLQEQLAGQLGVHTQTLSRWERAVREPKPSVLERIAEATGKPISFFIQDAPGGEPDDVAAELKRLRESIGALPGGAAPNHPGVEALLSNPTLVAQLDVTEEDARRLRGLRDIEGKRIETLAQAIQFLAAVRAID